MVSMKVPRVYLSRKNLLTILTKMDGVKKGNPSFCTLIKTDDQHPVYPQTYPAIAVQGVEDEDYYIDREPGRMREDG